MRQSAPIVPTSSITHVRFPASSFLDFPLQVFSIFTRHAAFPHLLPEYGHDSKTCMCLNIGNQGNLDSKPDCSPLYLCSSCPNLIIGASKRNTLWSALFTITKKCSNIFLWCEQRLNVNILFLGNWSFSPACMAWACKLPCSLMMWCDRGQTHNTIKPSRNSGSGFAE